MLLYSVTPFKIQNDMMITSLLLLFLKTLFPFAESKEATSYSLVPDSGFERALVKSFGERRDWFFGEIYGRGEGSFRD